MGLVLDKLKRVQLKNLQGSDRRMILAFEALFAANFLLPGDIVYRASTTREQALPANGAAVSRALYPDLFAVLAPVAVVTISHASPGVVTWTAHGLPVNKKIVFSTNGALPAPLVAGTVYFVKTVLGVDTFTLSATSGGAVINTTTDGSGTHRAQAFPFGNGDGSTTFEVPTVTAVGGCNAFIIY